MIHAVTATVGVLCIIGAVLIATVGRMQWPRAVIALTLTGVTGLLNSTIGKYVHAATTGADHRVAQAIGQFTGVMVTGVVGAAVLTIAAFRVYHRHYDTKTIVATAAVPPTIGLIPGLVGTWAANIVGIVPYVFGGIVSLMFFGHW